MIKTPILDHSYLCAKLYELSKASIEKEFSDRLDEVIEPIKAQLISELSSVLTLTVQSYFSPGDDATNFKINVKVNHGG